MKPLYDQQPAAGREKTEKREGRKVTGGDEQVAFMNGLSCADPGGGMNESMAGPRQLGLYAVTSEFEGRRLPP
jgi:hypothetical protein